MPRSSSYEVRKFSHGDEVPAEVTGFFKAEQFITHLRAFRDFKMSEEQTAKELANLCNLYFVRWVRRYTKICDFIQIKATGKAESRSFQVWQCRGLRSLGPNLVAKFRGRVFYTSNNLNKHVLEDNVGTEARSITEA
jgi:hypothetical protein